MTLTNVTVLQTEINYSIPVKADYGDERVLLEIDRTWLDDYFPHRPHLTDPQRRDLVESNQKEIASMMLRKCEQQAWHDVNRAGSTIKQLDFTKEDFFSGPRLTDARLVMREQAGFQGAGFR